MAKPSHSGIETSRDVILQSLSREYEKHTVGELDPYNFGNAVAPLVNALAALALMERQEHDHGTMGEASRPDD